MKCDERSEIKSHFLVQDRIHNQCQFDNSVLFQIFHNLMQGINILCKLTNASTKKSVLLLRIERFNNTTTLINPQFTSRKYVPSITTVAVFFDNAS